MLKNFLISGAFLALGTVVNTPQVAIAQSNGESAPSCGVSSSERIVLEQPQILLSHDEGGAFIGPVATTIPAGTYNLSTTSYEDHIGSNDPTQDNETWYFEGYFDGTLVYTSPATTDIPDDINTVSDDFGQVSIPAIDSVRWVHNAFPDPAYHSVYASCIEFTVVDTIVDAECTIAFTTQDLKVTADVTASPADAVSEISYDWGDNTVETLAIDAMAMHTYAAAGSYTVTATTDNLTDGQVATCSTEVVVEENGGVLGENTDTDTPVKEVVNETPAETGSVLGTSTDGSVLANTGAPAIVSLLAGAGIATTAILTKRTS